MIGRWIGVDLDGTLAEYNGNVAVIGSPIEAMADRVRQWIKEGTEVRIVTARVSGLFFETQEVYNNWAQSSMTEVKRSHYSFALEQKALIEEWCAYYLGEKLPVTALKDVHMVELWDDRAVAVEAGTGRAVKFHGGNIIGYGTKEVPE